MVNMTTATDTHVQFIQSLYAAFSRGDVQTILDGLTPDVHWHSYIEPVIPWSGDFSTQAQVPKFFQAISENVDVLGFEPTEFVSEGDTIVSFGEFSCRVRSTGKSATTKWVFIWKFRGDKVCSYEHFQSPGLAPAFTV